MRLQFSNIGMIEKADVKINKLTILVGENDSGKSTLGKLLYSLVNGIVNLNSTFNGYKNGIITKNLDEIQKRVNNSKKWQVEEEKGKYRENFEDELDFIFAEPELIEIKKFKKIMLNGNSEEISIGIKKIIFLVKQYIDLADVEIFFTRIEEALKYTKENDFIRKLNLNEALNLEFKGQINNLFIKENKAKVKIQYQNTDIFSIDIIENRVETIKEYKTLYTNDVAYIETPFIFNSINDYFAYPWKHFGKKESNLKDHNDKLTEIILNSRTNKDFNPLDEALFDKELSEFQNIINSQLTGEVKFSPEKKDFVLIRDGKEILLSNTAMGIKSMALLSILLKSKFFDKDNILIIDEPEVHLHPKWQIEYARIIVALAKEFDTKIIITSHSPYFIEAIQKFSEHFEIRDETNFYMLEKNNKTSVTSTVRDVNDSLEEVYEKLGEAYKNLDDLTLGDL